MAHSLTIDIGPVRLVLHVSTGKKPSAHHVPATLGRLGRLGDEGRG